MITEITNADEEVKAMIMLDVRGEQWGVQIDCHITPLYCCNCRSQLDHLYKLDGGRYGHVGIVICKCGAEINCVDSDNIVEYLDTTTTFQNKRIGSYHIDFKNIYRLNNSSWTILKRTIGYDIQYELKGKTINLNELLTDISQRSGITLSDSTQHSFDTFNRLPAVINKWISLLDSLSKNNLNTTGAAK